jgi:hypothetical protein
LHALSSAGSERQYNILGVEGGETGGFFRSDLAIRLGEWCWASGLKVVMSLNRGSILALAKISEMVPGGCACVRPWSIDLGVFSRRSVASALVERTCT